MLFLEHCHIHDEDMPQLTQLTTLEYVELRGLHITVHGLEPLLTLKKLYYVGLDLPDNYACDHIEETKDRFRRENITLDIERSAPIHPPVSAPPFPPTSVFFHFCLQK
jgi:hypothetical protein